MSWSKAARRGAAMCLLALVVVAVTTCGFEPLYGQRGGGDSVVAHIAAIEVMAIPDRLGQVVRNHLREGLTPYGAPDTPRYRLHVTLRKIEEGIAFQKDDAVTRFNVILFASYDLVEAATGSHVTRGLVRSIAAYNVVRSDYATIAAARDAEARVAESVSDEIQTRIAIDLARRRAEGS